MLKRSEPTGGERAEKLLFQNWGVRLKCDL
jgi:hypothetical protein